jgi:hypothetical protein
MVPPLSLLLCYRIACVSKFEARRFPMLRNQETSQVALLQKLGQAWKFEGRICALQWQGKTIDYRI